jgi:Fe-S cluster assembly protein SufD
VPERKARRAATAASDPVLATAMQAAKAEDKWIAHTLEATAAEDDSVPQVLSALRSSCTSALATMRMPTAKNEEYRYTDLAPLTQSSVVSPRAPPLDAVRQAIAAHALKDTIAATLVVVDGVVVEVNGGGLPAGVYAGGLMDAPPEIVSFALGVQSRSRGGPLATLNGAMVRDVLVFHVPANVTVERPVHILYLSSGGLAGNWGWTKSSWFSI